MSNISKLLLSANNFCYKLIYGLCWEVILAIYWICFFSLVRISYGYYFSCNNLVGLVSEARIKIRDNDIVAVALIGYF